MSFIRSILGRGETTIVSLETEVKIPWQTYKKLLVLGPISIWSLWAVAWIVWMGTQLDRVSVWRWMTSYWWPWMLRWWWIPTAMCFLWIGTAPTWATVYRYLVETIVKEGPPYMPYSPDNGRWRPFRHPLDEPDEPEMAAPQVETVNIDLTTQPPGRKRPQISRVRGLMTGPDAARFYVAVSQGKTFSERNAKKYGNISRDVFNEHIRDPLLHRGLAVWKNERRHNLGVNLTTDGENLIKSRASRDTPLP